MEEALELLERLLSSKAFLQLVAAIVVFVWSLPRVRQWRADAEASRWEVVYRLAEVAVLDTWTEYTESVKRARADGTLTPEERQTARADALQTLRSLLRNRMPKISAEFTDSMLSALLQRVHAEVQKEGAIG